MQWFVLLPVLLPQRISQLVPPDARGGALGLLLSLSALIPLLLPPLVGYGSDRWGMRWPLIAAGSALDLAGVLWLGHAHSFMALLLSLLVVQLGSNLAISPYSALIPQLFPADRRGSASGALAAAQLLGDLLGGAVVLAVHGTAARCSVIALGLALGSALSLAALGGRAEGRPLLPPRPALWLFSDRAFLLLFLSRFLFGLGEYSVQPYLQFYLAQVVGRFQLGPLLLRSPAAATGLLLVVLTLAATFSSLWAGRRSDRWGRIPLLRWAGWWMAATALLLLLARSFGAVLAVAVLFGVGYGAFASVDWALGSDLLPDRTRLGRDMGLWHISLVAPQLLEAPEGRLFDLGNRLAPNLGFAWLFGIAALSLWLAVFLLGRIAPRSPAARPGW